MTAGLSRFILLVSQGFASTNPWWLPLLDGTNKQLYSINKHSSTSAKVCKQKKSVSVINRGLLSNSACLLLANR